MFFYERYKMLCEQNNITPTRASLDAGCKKGSANYWKKQYEQGKNAMPDTRNALSLADLFGVSMDYLLGRTDTSTDYLHSKPAFNLVNSELKNFDNEIIPKLKELQETYLKLDSLDREKVIAFIQGLLANDKYQIFKEKQA